MGPAHVANLMQKPPFPHSPSITHERTAKTSSYFTNQHTLRAIVRGNSGAHIWIPRILSEFDYTVLFILSKSESKCVDNGHITFNMKKRPRKKNARKGKQLLKSKLSTNNKFALAKKCAKSQTEGIMMGQANGFCFGAA